MLSGPGVVLTHAGAASRARPEVWRLDVDVILLLPGPAVDRALEALGTWRQAGLATPLLLCPSRESPIRGLAAGADRSVPEDVGPEELRAWLRALLRRRPHDAATLRIWDLQILPGGRAVQRSGRTIGLTRREYDLLTFLAYHRGKVISRTLIH